MIIKINLDDENNVLLSSLKNKEKKINVRKSVSNLGVENWESHTLAMCQRDGWVRSRNTATQAPVCTLLGRRAFGIVLFLRKMHICVSLIMWEDNVTHFERRRYFKGAGYYLATAARCLAYQ